MVRDRSTGFLLARLLAVYYGRFAAAARTDAATLKAKKANLE